MSCHSTSGGIVSTSLARAVTGLSEKEVQHVFHALKREAHGMASPSELDVQAWRTRQYDLLHRMKRMSDTRRDKLRDRLFRSRSESVPDGATFYAWSAVEARARQEAALREVAGAVDLAPPGSQADQYTLGEDGRPTRVWYASYGSNLHRDRFMNYIQGGSPEGSTRVYDGCTDKTEPADDIPIRFAGARPHFALTSRVWRGGIAFIDQQKDESAQGLGRAYDISIDQFDEVVAQENGLPTRQSRPVPLEEALTAGRSVIGNGSYETVLHIGDYNGAPVLTFTAPFSTHEALTRTGHIVRQASPKSTPVRMPVMTNKPSAAYLRMIGGGLKETFGMDEVQQADYLRGCPGGDRWSRQQMVRILRGQEPDPPRAQVEGLEKQDTATPTPVSTTQTGSKAGSKAGAKRAAGGMNTSVEFSHRDGRATTPRSPQREAAAEKPSVNARNPRGRSSAARSDSGSSDARTTLVRARVGEDGRRELPRVKQYASREDQRAGVGRWTRTVKRHQDELNSVQSAITRFERYRASEEGKDTWGASHDASRRNVEQLRARYEDTKRLLAQAESRLETAKAQKPAKFYSPGRNLAQWRDEDERVLGIHREAERTRDEKRAMLVSLPNDAPPKMRSALVRHVTRMEEAMREAEARLAEIRAAAIPLMGK